MNVDKIYLPNGECLFLYRDNDPVTVDKDSPVVPNANPADLARNEFS